MFKWLFEPVPLEGNLMTRIKNASIGGIVVALFLYVFKPFGSDPNDSWVYLLECLAFGGITFFTAAIHAIGVDFFLNEKSEENWVVWKTVFSTLLLVMMIGAANWLFSYFVYGGKLNWYHFFQWQKMTFMVGVVPTLVGVFLYQRNLLKKYKASAENLDRSFQKKEVEPATQKIELKGDNQNESLTIEADDFLYATSASNYVEIFYKKDNEIKTSILRSTLKKLETQLSDFDQLYRCHRAYFINLQQVEKISGNAQGYKLHLKNSATIIPVSRSLNEEISNKFS